MGLAVSTQSITSTASELGTAGGSRTSLVVRNPAASGATIYVGASDVTVAEALFVLAPGDSSLVITDGDRGALAGHTWSALTASGTAAGVVVGES